MLMQMRAPLIVTLVVLGIMYAAPVPSADLPTEKPAVASLMPDNGHRLYLVALDFQEEVHVIDGDSMRILGKFNDGTFGSFNVSADRKTLYASATYFSRGDHGTTTDVVEMVDAATLNYTGEVVLPPKRAKSFAEAAYLQESAGASYLFVQNATPQSSVTIIDLALKQVLTELPTSGCFGIYPSPTKAARFASLCGDGAVVTVDFDAAGKETGRERSAVLFDPINDPLFISGVPAGDRMIFMSFLGTVHEIDFSGAKAVERVHWSVVDATAAKEGWRPGGFQPIAYNHPTGQLYVAMHPHGVEGSHYDAAEEIWKLDVAKRAALARVPSKGILYIAVSKDDHPILFAESEPSDANKFTRLVKFDGITMTRLDTPKMTLSLDNGGPLNVE